MTSNDYLGGYDTEDQRAVFEEAAALIAAEYERRFPDSPDDRDSMTADAYSAAAMIALGDTTLAEVRRDYERAQSAYLVEKDRRRGAALAAYASGVSKSQIARDLGVTRPALDKWIG